MFAALRIDGNGGSNKNLDFSGKTITVKSANGPATCTIDCQNSGRAFYLHNGEKADTRIEGFTIKNGRPSFRGGGLFLDHSSRVTVANCIFSNNVVDYNDPSASDGGFGGGICAQGGSVLTVSKCVFLGNAANYTNTSGSQFSGANGGIGGGVYVNGATAILTDCVFARNQANYDYEGFTGGGFGGSGGAACVDGGGTVTVTNCTFFNNSTTYTDASDGGGFSTGGNFSDTGNSHATVTNSILWGGFADAASQIVAFVGSTIGVTYCDVQGGFAGTGNINVDPVFVSKPNSNYRLQATSLCINVGSGAASNLPPDDLDGKPRIIGSAPDLGAYEFGTLNTLLTVVNTTAPAGQPVLLRALLRRLGDAAGVSGEPLAFSLDGTKINTVSTIANGTAGFVYTLPANIATGKHTIDVDWAGDANYAASHGTGTLTVAYPTVLTAPSVSGKIGQNVLLRSLLRRLPDAAGVSGKATDFYLDGTKVGTATTAATGIASLSYMLPAGLASGSHTLTFKFAGDSDYTASQGTATLTAQYQSVLTIASASGQAGKSVLLRAALRRLPDAAFVAGKTLTFSLDGDVVGTVSTPVSGTANLVYTLPGNTAAGSHTLTVSFAGDSDYLPVSGTATVTVNP